ncbi:uncharacterized protein TrAtP1_005053 [Trichoderma atroviride]|uniref:uncharacterized protein n=1 Tax=Hypocrea atroviridis TaxID=63577 RepID=UPI003331C2C3|nr:hypothetical protein TrAtP1_005053 [Trichoderma atroviride]
MSFSRPPPRRQRRARVCKDEAHHVRVQRLLHDPRAHAKVVRVLDAGEPNAVDLCRLNGRRHAHVSGHEAKAVAPIDLRNHRRHLLQLGLCSSIQDALADALHVRRDAVHAVRVDASQIRCHETPRYSGRIVWGHAVAFEDVLDEAPGLFGGDGDFGLLCFGHG